MPAGFEVASVWRARGRGFQMAVLQPDGVTIHLTGQVAWDRDENIVGRGDIEVQTRQCFENMRRLLEEAGGRLDHVVSLTTYFTDRLHLTAIQKIRSEFFTKGQEPASTSVGVAALGDEDFLVELAAVAVIPQERFRQP